MTSDTITANLIAKHIVNVNLALANPFLTEAQRRNLNDSLVELRLSLEATLS
jgi:hypothetical protein